MRIANPVRSVVAAIILAFLFVTSTSLLPSFLGNAPAPVAQVQPAMASVGPQSGSPPGPYFDHLVFIIMENEGIDNICGGAKLPPCNGSNSPYMSSLANTYGIDEQYLSLVGTSEPNYIGILGASDQNCTSNCGAGTIHAPNLVDRLESAGLSWKGYMENQTPAAGCDNSDHEPYQHEHNPFVEFYDIDNNPSRCDKIVLANPSLNSTCTVIDCALIRDLDSSSAPNFIWLTPNDCDNMHAASVCTNGCTTAESGICIKDGDNYLKSLVPNILNSYTFQHDRSALFVAFDEGNGYCPLNGSSEDCMYAVWAGPVAKTSFVSTTKYNHYSFTKTIETNWNLPTLTSNDAGATSMTEFLSAPAADFSISATPSTITELSGLKSNSTITLSSTGGFSGTITLTSSSSPTGPTITLNPSTVTLTSGETSNSTMTVLTATTGNYTVTIKAASGSLTHDTSVFVVVQDFSITSNPSNLRTDAGAQASSTVTITAINHFAGKVSLSVVNTAGLSTSIAPASITGHGTATLTSSSQKAANYTATVTGTSSNLSHSTTVNVQVVDFTIAASSASANVNSSITTTITITSLNHFNGTVTLTDSIPTGLTCGPIAPTNLSGHGSATVSCTTAAEGNYTLTVAGTSMTLSHASTTNLQFRDFSVTVTAPSKTVVYATFTTNITTLDLNGFKGTVTLTADYPTDLSCGPILPSIVNGSEIATLSCSGDTPGDYAITITGTSGNLSHVARALISVEVGSVEGSLVPANPLGLLLKLVPILGLLLSVIGSGLLAAVWFRRTPRSRRPFATESRSFISRETPHEMDRWLSG